jgi:hypothetical protein
MPAEAGIQTRLGLLHSGTRVRCLVAGYIMSFGELMFSNSSLDSRLRGNDNGYASH